MTMLHPEWPRRDNRIGAISTMRSGGISTAPYDAADGSGGLNLALHVGDDPHTVARNRAALRECLPAEPIWLEQVHGSVVVHVHARMIGAALPIADASIATEPGVVCAVLTADCLPVLLRDATGSVVGAAHAGWRGLADGVLQRTVMAMRAAGAADVWAWLGPAIGPSQFEVGEEVRTAFCQHEQSAQDAFAAIADKPEKYLADLYQLARLALLQVNVSIIGGGDQCTSRQPDHYFSYRRDQRCGRMASLIWIR